MTAKKIKFTNSYIKAIKKPVASRSYFQDLKEKGLSLYITQNDVRTFYFRKRINGKDEKIIIGNFPDLSVENARKKLNIIKGQIAQGINPNQEKSSLRNELTLIELIDEYVEKHSKVHKKTWVYDDRDLRRISSPIHNLKLSEISTDRVRKLHDEIGSSSGIYQANRFLAVFKSMINKAIEWGYKGTNPANNIKKFREKSRDRFIQVDELPRFFKSLEVEENEVARDYFYLSLYTGVRKGNILSMKWSDVNFQSKEWRIPETKNGDPLLIPLIDEAIDVLNNRKIGNDNLGLGDSWVFPSATSKSGHFEEPKKVWKRVLNRANISDLRIHDIRRTLGSYQAITGSSLPIIGKSLGHKSTQATQIYSRLNMDPVRQSLIGAVKYMKTNK